MFISGMMRLLKRNKAAKSGYFTTNFLVIVTRFSVICST
jgi:hypothetical protein